jgi:hypothetical protein
MIVYNNNIFVFIINKCIIIIEKIINLCIMLIYKDTIHKLIKKES